jgi:NAD(P)H-hydrate epimerase
MIVSGRKEMGSMSDAIVLTTEQVRALDKRAIEEYGMPGVILMENAGRGAAEIALTMLPRKTPRVLILCGRGNNGGDGFVIGRHLHNHGVGVEFRLATSADKIDPASDAGVNLGIVQKMGLPLREIIDASQVQPIEKGRYDLLIDALLGTGLSGEVREPTRSLIGAINNSGIPVLAVDTPSGLNTDTGEILGVAVRATCTVTFAAAKRGFFQGNARDYVGALHVVDIGIPLELLEGAVKSGKDEKDAKDEKTNG